MPSLPSATWVDETLMDARQKNQCVCIRFGRTADPLCQRLDPELREASSSLVESKLLALYTVDTEEVPEFTFMYELYDPWTLMISSARSRCSSTLATALHAS